MTTNQSHNLNAGRDTGDDDTRDGNDDRATSTPAPTYDELPLFDPPGLGPGEEISEADEKPSSDLSADEIAEAYADALRAEDERDFDYEREFGGIEPNREQEWGDEKPENDDHAASNPSGESPKTNKLRLSERAMARAVPQVSLGTSPSYMDGLNEPQMQAINTIDGPLLVLAGAGTGKTRVLTTRIAHIMSLGRASPYQILAVTFTNKAAREMKDRIARLVGGAGEGMPWLGTFHAICVKILRRHAELVGLRSGFTILDTDDQIRLMKQLIEAENIDPKRWPARQLAGFIDNWKNKGLTPDRVPKAQAAAFGNGKGGKLYAAYQKRLKELNATDFGDLLLECIRLFRENPDVLADYQSRFRYILVDEYQDTNVAQYLWLRLLAQNGSNICCVGDDDQSIYGWRGAEVDNILRFEKDYEGATTIRLEQNYRSTGHILAAASHIIDHNEGRLGKTLFTEIGEGEKVAIHGVWDDEEEARTIGEEIEQAQRRKEPLNEIAILVRASFQMRAFEDRFVTLNLPYRVIGGPRFYERAEIRDATAYLGVLVNPAQDLKFERIVNTPKRGIGKASLQKVHAHARARSIPLAQAAREMIETAELPAKARKSFTALLGDFDRWRKMLPTMPHTELAEIILDESGYTNMWQQDKSPQAQSRLENLKELIRFMGDFENMQGFLEHVTLVMDTDAGNNDDAVSLMTLHAAKGLEFDTVFLPGWEDGLFPHQRSLDESGQSGLEEERRLAYVGITRAKKHAHISFAQNRRIHALWQSAIPSRFIDELPEAHVEIMSEQEGHGNYNRSSIGDDGSGFSGSTYNTPGWKRAQKHNAGQQQNRSGKPMPGAFGQNKSAQKFAVKNELTIDVDFTETPPGDGTDLFDDSAPNDTGFETGDRVFHQKFGPGSVVGIDGNNLVIDFKHSGRKKVVASFIEKH